MPENTFLCFDYGTKRTGVATGNRITRTASPQSTIRAEGDARFAAVAALLASGLADVGFGLEAAARQFGLDFIPLAQERYFLVCHTRTLDNPAMQHAMTVLRDEAFQACVNALPGYEARDCGRVTPWQTAFDGAAGHRSHITVAKN